MKRLILLLLALPMMGQAQVSYIASSNSDGIPQSTRNPGEPTDTAEDDLVICTASIGTSDGDYTAPADFSAIDASVISSVGTPSAMEFGLWYKVRGATAGNGYSFSYSGTADAMRVVCSTFRGADTTTPLVTFVEANHYGQAANAPNTAARAISATEDGMVYLYQINTQADITDAGAPTSYTLRFSEIGAGTTNRQVATATRAITSTSTETPGAWTNADGATSDVRNFTLSILPAAAADSGWIRRRR